MKIRITSKLPVATKRPVRVGTTFTVTRLDERGWWVKTRDAEDLLILHREAIITDPTEVPPTKEPVEDKPAKPDDGRQRCKCIHPDHGVFACPTKLFKVDAARGNNWCRACCGGNHKARGGAS